jgi:glycosyltransferase involved in cell wall biosynthesis
MKILHVIDELKVGGAQTHLDTMLEAASRRYPTVRHHILGLTENGAVGDRMRARGFMVDPLGLRGPLRARRFDVMANAIRRVIRAERPDVVEAHLTFSRLLALPVAFSLGVPVRIGYEQGDVYLSSPPFRAGNFLLQHAAQRVVVCSAALGDWAARTHGISRARLWVLHNCVDVARFTPCAERPPSRFGFGPETTVFAAVGSLGHGVNKRVDVAIRAIARARSLGSDAALVIAGDGAQRAELARLAEELGVASRVQFLGVREDVADVLRQCDAFCHAAPFEPFGIVCVEAMAVALPVIVPDQGGMREAVIDGETGLVYPALDHDALARGMLRLAESRELRRRLGAAGRRHAEARFSADGYVETLYEGYAEILARRGCA